MMRASRVAAALLAACALIAAWGSAFAQAWPARPLRLVMPLPPGTTADLRARQVAQALSEQLGQQVYVENISGAQTNIGMQAVARAAPDGYTYLFSVTSLSINPHLYRLGFDPLVDLAPVALIGRQPFVLVGRPTLAAGSPAALLAELKALPNPVTCAHSGGVTLIGCELLRSLGGLSITLIPYRGNLEAIARLSASEVDVLFDPVSSAYANTRAGRVKAFGVTHPGLHPAPFDRLPALAEALPGFELVSWYGILAPAATPRPIVERVNREVAAILVRPELRKALEADGIHAEPGTPEAFAEFIRREHARHGRVIRAAGIPVQE